ncbi:3-hydroxyacyl-CoA dehydrogenase family protein isoform 2 [Theobroma cacao]|uniref:3-hydroxyacyl-CoA dehydrogenase family protein isoform 2 n=1 Tax=Theobroma cacao TaxID=3641 RepID=A0A061FF12_THECC|nr:3-hydroxyacyl-CoA dehydrogenase family protein isoform 2 [Theobroma cacao]
MAETKCLAVVGSGQMGSGIAQLGAMHGLHVWLLDTDPVALSRASKAISSSLQRFVSKGQLSQQVIGMHFMNPPPIMKLVEIVRGADTSDETFHATKALAERFGKTLICSQDYSGFIVNRILMPMINEAFFTLYTGVATKEDIDTGMKLGTNHPMGPLELADFIGLDVCLSIMKVLNTGLGDSKYAPCPLLVQYVDAGRIGRKCGIGVYDYRRLPASKKSSPRL